MNATRLGAGVLACAVALAAAAAASASPNATDPLRIAGPTDSTSTNWSGYAATGGPFTSVSATWTAPSVACAAGENSYSAFWAGLDGYTDSTVEQLGTAADCVDGTPTYYAWVEMFPKLSGTIPIDVQPGDTITATVSTDGAGNFTLSMTDGNQPAFITTGKNKKAALSSAEVIAEAPARNHGPKGILPLADFGSASFTNIQVNGATIDPASAEEITMANHDGTVKAQPGPLDGGGFSDVWQHS